MFQTLPTYIPVALTKGLTTRPTPRLLRSMSGPRDVASALAPFKTANLSRSSDVIARPNQMTSVTPDLVLRNGAPTL
jgi:hypothetical protein